MLFNLFSRKKNKNYEDIESHVDVYSDSLIEDISELPFEKKLVYVKNGKTMPFPDKCEFNGIITTFEKEKFFLTAKKIYESSFAKDIVEKIEITQLNGAVGLCVPCDPNEKNSKFYVTIQIDPFKLGIVEGSGYIHEYSEKQCIEFRNILAHEFIHAEDEKCLINKFGIEEYLKIKSDTIAKLGKIILMEYSANRKIAEKYEYFDSGENIEKIIIKYCNFWGADVKSETEFNRSGTLEIEYAEKLNYAIATRCAFADVSPEKEKDLYISANVSRYKEYTKYIAMIRDLLSSYYSIQPLNAEQYKLFGFQIMNGLSEIYSFRKNLN